MIEVKGRCSCCGAEPSREIREAAEQMGIVPICMHEHTDAQLRLGRVLDLSEEMVRWVDGLVKRSEAHHGRRENYASALETVLAMLEKQDEDAGCLIVDLPSIEETATDDLQDEIKKFCKLLRDQSVRVGWEELRRKLVRFSVSIELVFDDLDLTPLWDGAPVE